MPRATRRSAEPAFSLCAKHFCEASLSKENSGAQDEFLHPRHSFTCTPFVLTHFSCVFLTMFLDGMRTMFSFSYAFFDFQNFTTWSLGHVRSHPQPHLHSNSHSHSNSHTRTLNTHSDLDSDSDFHAHTHSQQSHERSSSIPPPAALNC